MKRGRIQRRGFSLIELLTVIAIMAVLMGALFPMAASMKERGNQSACIGNLQSIGQALKLYRLDERDYPPALFGYLEKGKTEPTTFLYPAYARSRREFKCPNNLNRDNENAFSPVFNIGTNPGTSAPRERSGPFPATEPLGTKRGSPVGPVAYYLFDSYDGGIVPPRSGDPLGYEIHYRRDWASLFNDTSNQDRELLQRNPEDGTFVTTCAFHRTYTGANVAPGARSMDMVLFLDGHVDKTPSDQVGGPTGNGWRVTPR